MRPSCQFNKPDMTYLLGDSFCIFDVVRPRRLRNPKLSLGNESSWQCKCLSTNIMVWEYTSVDIWSFLIYWLFFNLFLEHNWRRYRSLRRDLIPQCIVLECVILLEAANNFTFVARHHRRTSCFSLQTYEMKLHKVHLSRLFFVTYLNLEHGHIRQDTLSMLLAFLEAMAIHFHRDICQGVIHLDFLARLSSGILASPRSCVLRLEYKSGCLLTRATVTLFMGLTWKRTEQDEGSELIQG